MNIQNQFFDFYQPHLKKIKEAIFRGKTLIFVGINSIGKTQLVYQILSERFKKIFLNNTKAYFIFLSFKDSYPPTTEQLYRYCLKQTAKKLNFKIPLRETINNYSFFALMSEIIRKVKQDERISIIFLDFQNILNQEEPFFKSLIYLHSYSSNKLSYLIFSEPQILDSQKSWIRIFIQHFTNFKFIFLKTFNNKTTLADIKNESNLYQIKLSQANKSMILKYSKGLHGMIGSFCLLFKNFPEIKSIRKVKKVIDNHKLFQFWFKEIIDSLPSDSIRILKKIAEDKKTHHKFLKNIYFRWLVDLTIIKKDGTIRYPPILRILDKQEIKEIIAKNIFKFRKNQFYISGKKLDLPKKEFIVLRLLHKDNQKLVTFDKFSQVLWPDNPEKFSLWAISQLIKRLRKRLIIYNFNPNLIQTVRGKGYLLQYDES